MAQKELDPSKIVSALISQAKGFEDKKSFDTAIALYKKALEYDPTNKEAKEGLVRMLYLLGVQAYANEDYQKAIDYFTKVLELDPKNEKAKEGLARAEAIRLFGTKEAGYVIGGATAQGILYALLSSPMYSEEMRQNYLRGVQAYANGDYQRAIDLWVEIYNQLQDGDPAKKKLLDYINRARKQMGWEPVEEPHEITAKPKVAKVAPAPAEEKKGPPILDTLHGVLRRTAKCYLNHTGLDGLADILGKIKADSMLSSKGTGQSAGERWLKYISTNVLNSPQGAVKYIGARKLGPDKWQMVFYNENDDSFYLVTAYLETTAMKPSGGKWEFSAKKLDNKELAYMGLIYERYENDEKKT